MWKLPLVSSVALPKGQLSIFWRTRAASASGQQLFLAANKSEQLDSSDKADAQQAMSGLLRAAGLRSVSDWRDVISRNCQISLIQADERFLAAWSPLVAPCLFED